MIASFTRFFLENRKITMILIILISIFGMFAYVLLPKQYNPSIVAPAFSIRVPASGYDSDEASRLIARSIENKVAELSGIDKIYSYSADSFASVMVQFRVGVDQETAKTRLYDKMYSNYDLRPFGVQDVQIASIDPEDLPQVSFALTYSGSDLDTVAQGKYLRSVALHIREELKHVPGTTLMDIVGGYRNNLSVELDRSKLEAYGLDATMVIARIREHFVSATMGSLESQNGKIAVLVSGSESDAKSVGDIVLSSPRHSGTPLSERGRGEVYVRDIAMIRSGPIDIASYYRYADTQGEHDAVFLWVAKLQGSNAVTVVEWVHERMEEIKKSLPKNVVIHTIQDEGETAREATSELLLHLFVSIGIVLAILVVFLGMRDALNAAFCIPMVLGIVFIVALIFGIDINRITLFALILSLGILVDDSIVMVENNARHLAMIARTGRSPVEAILDSVREVGASILFSTITRIMSFIAMFAVTGMMGDYMKPIPVFASIALSASLVIAFSINPFIAVLFHKNWKGGHHDTKEWKFLAWYGRLLGRYINREERTVRTRRLFKIAFWFALFAIIVSPIALGIFKARMLPKADKDQVYLWIDAPRSWTASGLLAVEGDASRFLLGLPPAQVPHPSPLLGGEGVKKMDEKFSPLLIGEGSGVRWEGAGGWGVDLNGWASLPSDLRIVREVSSSVGDRFLSDFSNLFRGGQNRTMEHQLTMRINLTHSADRDIKSEEYTIRIRPLLRDYLLARYPDLRIRLLEEPPGPPTQATFHMKMKGQEDLSSDELLRFSEAIKSSVQSIAREEDIVDLVDSVSSTAPRYRVRLDSDRIAETGLSVSQVSQTVALFFRPTEVSIIHSPDARLEATDIVVGFPKSERNDLATLRSLSFTNSRGEKIALSDIATITPDFAGREVYTDGRSETIHLYGELGNNSVVYPVFRLYSLLGSKEFEEKWYKRMGMSFYGMDFVGVESEGCKNSILSPHPSPLPSSPHPNPLLGGEGAKEEDVNAPLRLLGEGAGGWGVSGEGWNMSECSSIAKKYRMEWGGEWELTMDTFRDLGLAMILSLSAIYFLIVAQFRSFLVGGIVMTTFLLSFFGIFPGFSILYLLSGTYFTATAMIGAIALGWLVVGNAIILLDYTNQLLSEGKSLEYSVIEGAKKRFVPIMLTSIAAIAGSFIITGDPVWSGLAWSLIWWLSASAVLTLFLIPIFYYTHLRKYHSTEVSEVQMERVVKGMKQI